jgi:transposase
VVEVARVRRGDRRTGKSDAIDAGLVALQGLRMDADRLPSPRGDGDREGLRILLGARSDMSRTRTERVNRLRALLLSGSDADRVVARGGLGHAVLAGIVDRGDPAGASRDQQIRTGELRRLAAAIADADRQLAANKKQLAELVDELSPGLTARRGVGPVSAAQAIVSYSHYGRCRTEAAFAALAGVNPIPASSGLTVRHRLNRAGDRNLNQAIHTIVVTRWRDCPRTGRYIARRRAEGKTDREIRRCLKRYIARELYRNLNRAFKPATNHTVTAG